MLSCAQKQSALAESLQQLHDSENRLRIHLERIRKNRLVSLISIVERYRDGNLSLVLYFDSERHRDIPGRLLPSPHCEPLGVDLSGVILRFDAADRRIENSWDKQPVFISQVQSVYGPNGVIPSCVRLYLVKNHVEQSSGGRIYSIPAKGIFKGISCRIDREFSEFSQSAGSDFSNGFDPGIVEGALEVMESIPGDQSDRTPGTPVRNVVLDDIVSKLRINLDCGHITLFQQLNPSIQLADVMFGPVDFEPRVAE